MGASHAVLPELRHVHVGPRRTWRDRVRRVATAPRLTRPAFTVLRRYLPLTPVPGPVARFVGLPGPAVLVTRGDDVAEVLARPDTFTIAEVNDRRLREASGPFFLGWDDADAHRRERDLLEAAAPASDLPRIRSMVTEEAARRLDATAEIDVVSGFARPIAVHLIGAYLGVGHPDPSVLAAWLRVLFDGAFLADDARARAAVAEAAPLLAGHLRELVASSRRDGPDPTTVLGRLVAAQDHPSNTWLDDEAVRRNIAGLVIGACETMSRAVALVVEELLERPEVRGDVAAAHRSGDEAAVLGHVRECLRFRPHQPVLVRWTDAATTVGGRKVRARRAVVAVTDSAAFDPTVVDDPTAYRHDRPYRIGRPFGDGMHECFGRHLNEVVLPVLVGSLAARGPLRRSGPTRWDGPFPDSLRVRIEGAT